MYQTMTKRSIKRLRPYFSRETENPFGLQFRAYEVENLLVSGQSEVECIGAQLV